jgi:hypothetical protein
MAVSMRWKLRTAAAVAALAFGACGGESKSKDEDEKDGGPVTRSDAGGGGGAGDAGFQVPIAQLNDGVAGKPCMADGDCAGTETSCLFGACSGTCESNANCGSGGTCVKAVRGAYGQYGACAKVCTAKSDCSGEQDCREGIETGSIFSDLVGAVQDAGISLGDAGLDVDVTNLPKTCGPSLNTVDLPDGLVSTPCTGAAQCMPGECATDINLLLTFPNGYCTGACLTDDQCGAGAACYKDPGTALLKGAGRCLATCSGTGTSTCKHGLVCRTSQLLFESAPRSYCLPAVPDAGVPSSDAGGATTGDAGVDAAATGDGG